jgi:hypothetical protein
VKDSTACRGCRNDYYNGGAGLNGKCWSLDDAKIVVRFKIHRDQVPTLPRAFERVKVPNCYHKSEWSFVDRLPDFVKVKDVVRS